jgi:hypothetical protein
VSGVITVSCPAGVNGVVATLASNSTSTAQPAVGSVTIGAGATTATFVVTTSRVTKNKTVTIAATTNGGTISRSLVVTP